jgi:hypothetical protein
MRANAIDCYQSWLRTDWMKIDIDVVVGPPLAALAVEPSRSAAS